MDVKGFLIIVPPNTTDDEMQDIRDTLLSNDFPSVERMVVQTVEGHINRKPDLFEWPIQLSATDLNGEHNG